MVLPFYQWAENNQKTVFVIICLCFSGCHNYVDILFKDGAFERSFTLQTVPWLFGLSHR